MTVEQTRRIDAGIKRGPRKKAPPPNARDPVTHRYLPIIPPEQREALLQDALESLQQGQTTDEIGKRHGVSGARIRQWLLADDRADQARAAYFSQELMNAHDEISSAQDPLTLARGRERFRAVSWLAERRNARMFGQQLHQTIEMVGDLGAKLRQVERVIEHDAGVSLGVTPPALPDNSQSDQSDT